MEQRAWHQALAYAVTGQRRPELGYQAQPDLAELSLRLGELAGADVPRRRTVLTAYPTT